MSLDSVIEALGNPNKCPGVRWEELVWFSDYVNSTVEDDGGKCIKGSQRDLGRCGKNMSRGPGTKGKGRWALMLM